MTDNLRSASPTWPEFQRELAIEHITEALNRIDNLSWETIKDDTLRNNLSAWVHYGLELVSQLKSHIKINE